MEYKFLDNNELVIIDYIPGSSGQFFSRLWCELDKDQNYDDERTMRENGEVYYDTMLPKRIVNFFIEQNKPKDQDYNTFFEFLATTLYACRSLELFWIGNNTEFYPKDVTKPNADLPVISGQRIVYHIHSWNMVPWSEVHPNIKHITIQSKTIASKEYQYNRAQKFYPTNNWDQWIKEWNDADFPNSVDFCDMLVNKDSNKIINWFRSHLGNQFAEGKVIKAQLLLEEYYKEVDNVPVIS